MSILVTRSKEQRNLLGMTAGTLFCIVFAFIYNIFGHGVKSIYMNYMFLYPLVLGVMGYGALVLLKKIDFFSQVGMKTYNWGVVTLVIGNMLRGIFDIAGTSSPYVLIYWIVGTLLLLAGVVFGILKKDR